MSFVSQLDMISFAAVVNNKHALHIDQNHIVYIDL